MAGLCIHSHNIQETIPTEQPTPKPSVANTSPPMQKVGGTIIIINIYQIYIYLCISLYCIIIYNSNII